MQDPDFRREMMPDPSGCRGILIALLIMAALVMGVCALWPT